METNKKEDLSSKHQELEKNKMLADMEKEIGKLKFDLKHAKISNVKIRFLRALKIFIQADRLIAPYVITAGLIFGGTWKIGATPFMIDNHKKNLEIQKEIDSLGHIRYEEQHQDFEDSDNEFTYYGKWKKEDDGFYSRKIKVYDAKKIEAETIEKIINDNDITSLDEIFGKPKITKTVRENSLTEEEISNPAYIEAIIYSEDKNDVIIVKETLGENIATTIIEIFFVILLSLLIALIREEKSSFDFREELDEIRKKYPYIDKDDIIKMLELKEQNYKRLTR